jgi:hypothetical protein
MKILFYWIFLAGATAFGQQIPDIYCGTYKGKLQLFSKDKVNTIDMEFKLRQTQKPDIYDYVLIYHGPQKKDIRAYTLKIKDSTGNFLLDENNGIVIPTKFVNRSLHSFFEVESSLLKTSIHFYNDYLDFEIVMANTKKTDTTQTEDQKFKVLSYPIAGYQYARLVKQ